jgi:hypothetical protein
MHYIRIGFLRLKRQYYQGVNGLAHMAVSQLLRQNRYRGSS